MSISLNFFNILSKQTFCSSDKYFLLFLYSCSKLIIAHESYIKSGLKFKLLINAVCLANSFISSSFALDCNSKKLLPSIY